MIETSMIVAYFDGMVKLQFISVLSALLLIAFISYLLSKAFGEMKSYTYRKLVSDLVVVGKLRNIAKEEQIELTEEEIRFKSWLKKQSLVDKDLHQIVEQELESKISEMNEKELKEKKK